MNKKISLAFLLYFSIQSLSFFLSNFLFSLLPSFSLSPFLFISPSPSFAPSLSFSLSLSPSVYPFLFPFISLVKFFMHQHMSCLQMSVSHRNIKSNFRSNHAPSMEVLFWEIMTDRETNQLTDGRRDGLPPIKKTYNSDSTQQNLCAVKH